MSEIAQAVSDFSRVRGNELAKGFYATFDKDVEMVREALSPSFGYNSRGTRSRTISILDPCAGEGAFLSAVKRKLQVAYRDQRDRCIPHDISTYAVELDAERFAEIRGVHTKFNSSFFDTRTSGKFDIVLLNPPYNRQDNQLLAWVEKGLKVMRPLGLMVLIIPEYELRSEEMSTFIKANFKFFYAFKSAEYDQFKQVVVFLSPRKQDNWNHSTWNRPKANLADEKYPTWAEYHQERTHPFIIDMTFSDSPNPLMLMRDMEPYYEDFKNTVERVACRTLEASYPKRYDTSIKPLASLRTAHAVQLAAMNSQIESLTINGDRYLAKYMVTVSGDKYEDTEQDREVTVYKPSVEAFLMAPSGAVSKAKDLGFDYLEINQYLSGVLLRKLTREYEPLHEIGGDPEFLREELDSIGLLAPQREAVKAVIKGFRAGMKGIGIRANTGSGKTWMAKAVKYILKSRRTIMITEPHLVPQMAAEYADESFDIHIIDSWQKLTELEQTRPPGLYLIPYSRLRMHPKYRPVEIRLKSWNTDPDTGERTVMEFEACPSCFGSIRNLKRRKTDKAKCPHCDEPLYAYMPEDEYSPVRYGDWSRAIRLHGESPKLFTANKQLPYIRLLKKIPFDLAIFDEVHNAANSTSNQGAAFIRLAARVPKTLVLTATITNGIAKSIYNLLWGLTPRKMEEDGWEREATTRFQSIYGAYKEIRKVDNGNRHRSGEKVSTQDTAGISPAVLNYTLPCIVNVDSDDFDDRPPIEREVLRSEPHEAVAKAMQVGERIIMDEIDGDDAILRSSVRNPFVLRVSDTFHVADDNLTLRDNLLGVVPRFHLAENELTAKEQDAVTIAKRVKEDGERMLCYTLTTQKVNIRPRLKHVFETETGATVEILPDTVPSHKILAWFERCRADIVIANPQRIGTGLNLSQFNNLMWFDGTSNSRLMEQGEGRILRVNTAQLHRLMFGEVRPVRFYYLTNSMFQDFRLSYTLEKRMTSKLAEGEIPDIDPSDCGMGEQSFSAMMTAALQSGDFEYTDPSELLRQMVRSDNQNVRAENLERQPRTPAQIEPEQEIAEAVAEESTTRSEAWPTEQAQLWLFDFGNASNG